MKTDIKYWKKEAWKVIENYPDYQISNFGRVKSTNYNGNMKHDRLLSLIKRRSGYIVVNLYRYIDGVPKMKQFRVHQLVMNAFSSNHDNLPEINHIDGDKTNNKLSNLEYASRSHNMLHAYANKLKHQPKGVVTTKLNPNKVIEIRYIYKHDNYSHYDLSKMYNVSEAAIANVVNRKSWRNV